MEENQVQTRRGVQVLLLLYSKGEVEFAGRRGRRVLLRRTGGADESAARSARARWGPGPKLRPHGDCSEFSASRRVV